MAISRFMAIVCTFALCGLAGSPVLGANYYEGKTLTLIVGEAASGGYAVFARVLAENLGRHIPGQPRVVVQYMPGAAGRTLTNYMYNGAPRDGFTIGAPPRNVLLEQVTGTVNVSYRVEDFTWLGASFSLADDAYCLIVRSDSPYRTLDDLRKPGAPALFGGQAPGSANADVVQIAKDALHLNIQLIRGYPSPGEINMAIKSGELVGNADGWKTFSLYEKDAVESGGYRCIVQFRPDRWSGLPDSPTALESASTTEDKQLIELVEALFLLGRPYMAPPGMPAEAAAILRNAFMETHSDPAFIAEFQKLGFLVNAQSDQDVLAIVDAVEATPPAVAARYKADIAAK
jgi:tripartite-type tricarboxylate transporter receptor subunit TctC